MLSARACLRVLFVGKQTALSTRIYLSVTVQLNSAVVCSFVGSMVSQIKSGTLSSWVKDQSNSAKVLKDSYYHLDCVISPPSQKGPFIAVTKTGDSQPLFQLRLRDIETDGDIIFVAVDVPDQFATKKHLFKFAGEGKTVAEKADSFSCSTMLRGFVFDKECLPQPGFPNIVLKMRPWPMGVDLKAELEGWSLPMAEILEGPADYVAAFKEACNVSTVHQI